MNNTTENPITAETTTDTGGLIPVFTTEIGGISQLAVDARELHQFLDVKRDYSTWIKRRIQECGLVENEDYLVTKIGEQLPSGTKYRFDYYLILEVAKELSMVERNAQGRMIRKYFIECEKQLHTNVYNQPEDKKNIVERIALHEIMYDRMWYLLLEKRDELTGANTDINNEVLWYHINALKRLMYIDFINDIKEKFDITKACDSVTEEMIEYIVNWTHKGIVKYPEFISNK